MAASAPVAEKITQRLRAIPDEAGRVSEDVGDRRHDGVSHYGAVSAARSFTGIVLATMRLLVSPADGPTVATRS